MTRRQKLLPIAKKIRTAVFKGESYQSAKWRLAGNISPEEFATLDDLFDELEEAE